MVRQFYLAVCLALPVGDMLKLTVFDNLKYGSTISTTVVNSYIDCLHMVNDSRIAFWCVEWAS